MKAEDQKNENNKSPQKDPKFFLFDAEGKILGRLASEIAIILNGKNEVEYDPARDNENWVIVINSDGVRLSAEKGGKKIYWRFSGYPGGIYKRTFEEMMALDSTKVIKEAIKGMLPKNKLSSAKLKRLRVFKDDQHPYKDKITEQK